MLLKNKLACFAKKLAKATAYSSRAPYFSHLMSLPKNDSWGLYYKTFYGSNI